MAKVLVFLIVGTVTGSSSGVYSILARRIEEVARLHIEAKQIADFGAPSAPQELRQEIADRIRSQVISGQDLSSIPQQLAAASFSPQDVSFIFWSIREDMLERYLGMIDSERQSLRKYFQLKQQMLVALRARAVHAMQIQQLGPVRVLELNTNWILPFQARFADPKYNVTYIVRDDDEMLQDLCLFAIPLRNLRSVDPAAVRIVNDQISEYLETRSVSPRKAFAVIGRMYQYVMKKGPLEPEVFQKEIDLVAQRLSHVQSELDDIQAQQARLRDLTDALAEEQF